MNKTLNLRCKYCARTFSAKPSSIKKGWGIFCSRQCHYAKIRIGKIVPCEICGEKIYRSPTKLKHSKSGKYFCSKSCQTLWRNKEFSGKRHALWKDGSSTYRDVLIKAGVSRVCSMCGTRDRRILAAHHKDENRKNYNLDNLIWLCHNCHHRVHRGAITVNW